MPRCYNLVLVSFLVLLSQILASQIGDVRHLWQASTLLGLAYGSIFGIYPTLCIEWFGMRMSNLTAFLTILTAKFTWQLISRRTGDTYH